MSDEWFFRLKDIVQGPVAFNELLKAYSTGLMSDEFEIRRKDFGDWRPINSFRRMVETRAAHQPLAVVGSRSRNAASDGFAPREQPMPVNPPAVPASLEDSGTFSIAEEDTVVDVPADPGLATHPWFQFLLTRIAQCQLCLPGWDPSFHTWFIWCNEKQAGPFALLHLVELARDGQLKATDWIGCVEAGRWGPLDPSTDPAQMPMQFAPQPPVWMPPYAGYIDPMMQMAVPPMVGYAEAPEEDSEPTGKAVPMPLKLPEPNFSPTVEIEREVKDRKDQAANSKNDAAIFAAQLLKKVQVKKKKTAGGPAKPGGWSLGARKPSAETSSAAVDAAQEQANPMDLAAIGAAAVAAKKHAAPKATRPGSARAIDTKQLALIVIAVAAIGGAAWFLLG